MTFVPTHRGLRSAVAIFTVLLMGALAPATVTRASSNVTYAVNVTSDDATATACSSSSTNCSLRGAIADAATLQDGDSATITLPAGTYNLTLGELDLFSANNQTVAISGASTSGTIINGDGQHLVFAVNYGPQNSVLNLSNLTIQNGNDNPAASSPGANAGFGGGALIAGGNGNQVTISQVAFLNNSAEDGAGGAIQYFGDGSPNETLTVTNSTFSGNTINAGGSGSFGGAIDFNGGSALSVSGSTFTGNTAGSTSPGHGGAIAEGSSASGTVSFGITTSSFTGNQATGNGSDGGAIWNHDGALNLQYNRIVGNSSATGSQVFQQAAAGGSTTANDNWWGTNAGPGSALAGSPAPLATSWLQLRHAASPTTIQVGQTSALTADLLGRNTGTPISGSALTGLPSFPSSGTIFGNAVGGSISNADTQFVNGVATATFTASTPGAASVDATADNQTVTASITVSKLDSTTVVTSPSNGSSVYGQSVTFTATVSGVGSSTTPTGTVQFQDNGTNIGSPVGLSGGTATFSTTALTVGGHSITGVYSGDNTFNGSTSPGLPHTVSKADTTTLLASSVNPSVYGQNVTFTATVSANAPGAGTPTGTVTFSDGSTTIGTGSLSGGQASLTVSSLGFGTHSITAAYGGDGNFNASSATGAQAVSQVVNQSSTQTTVVSSVSPSVNGQSVTFTATVAAIAPGAGTPTGSVQFQVDGVNLGGPVTLSGGSATSSGIALGAGPHSVTVTYGGDSNFSGSSGSATQQVNQASTATNVSTSNGTTLYGQQVTFTATVSAVSPGAGTPTGTVNFFDGATQIGSGSLGATGTATFSTVALPAGGHTITATYVGDTNFTGSSGSVGQQVNQSSTTTAVISSNNPSAFNDPVAFTATVSAVAPGGGTPTGTVQFVVDNVTFGSPVTLVNGVATSQSTSTLAVGPHSVSAVYSGDGNFLTSSGNLTQTVRTASTMTTLTSSANPSILHQSVTFTATVVGAGTPTGTVDFFDGATKLGTSTLSTSGGVTTATFTTSSLAIGDHSMTATYSGNSTLNGSSGQLVQQVTYKIVALYSQTSPNNSGSSVAIKVQIEDVNGVNLSASGIALTLASPALSPSPSPGSQPVGQFTFMAKSDQGPMYQFNVKTTNYPAHTYTLSFSVSGDPVTHTVRFVIG